MRAYLGVEMSVLMCALLLQAASRLSRLDLAVYHEVGSVLLRGFRVAVK